jgi:hypothetical protein
MTIDVVDMEGPVVAESAEAITTTTAEAEMPGADLTELLVDLLPGFEGAGRALTLADRRSRLGPACAVCGDLLQDSLGEVVPDVPAVADVRRVRQGAADGLGVGAGAVSAHDFDARMLAQPGLERAGLPIG